MPGPSRRHRPPRNNARGPGRGPGHRPPRWQQDRHQAGPAFEPEVDTSYGNQAVQDQLRQQDIQGATTLDTSTPEQLAEGSTSPKAAYTTGGPGQIVSTKLPQDGSWDQGDFRPHHSDRSNSWAANNIRDGQNQDLQAWDFTFVDLDERGNETGSTQGVSLILPWPAKVIDIQKSFEGSGNYGKYIAVESLETGLRFEVHHLDTVSDFAKGQELDGGTVIGTQGGSGNSRNSYAVHVDIVGTVEAVEQFVRSNQQGTFTKRVTSGQ